MKKEQKAYRKGYRVTSEGELVSCKGEIINGCINNCGYVRFAFRYNGKKIYCNVHRLQAFQKYGNVLFLDGVVTRHKNSLKTDNSYENILIGTHSDNQMDIPEHIRLCRSLHATSFIRKYNKVEVSKFHHDNGNSYKKTMAHFNISSKGTLHFILNGRKPKK